MENWKKIKEFKTYEISNLGNIKNKYGKLLKLLNNQKGYLEVRFVINFITYKRIVHRLVAKAFIPNPDNKATVNHINGIRSDNNVNNLEWNTYSENHKHSFKFLNRKPSGASVNNNRSIKIKGTKNNQDFIFDSIMKAEKAGLAFSSNISLCLSGKRKTAGGYKWHKL